MKAFLSLLFGFAFLLSVPTFATSPISDDAQDSIHAVTQQTSYASCAVLNAETVYVFRVHASREPNWVPMAVHGSYSFDISTSWAPEWGSVATALHYAGHQAKTYRGERAYLVRQ